MVAILETNQAHLERLGLARMILQLCLDTMTTTLMNCHDPQTFPAFVHEAQLYTYARVINHIIADYGLLHAIPIVILSFQ